MCTGGLKEEKSDGAMATPGRGSSGHVIESGGETRERTRGCLEVSRRQRKKMG